jgi:hypothetical protein
MNPIRWAAAAFAVALAATACSTHPLVPASVLHQKPPPAHAATFAAGLSYKVAGIDVYANTNYPLATVTANGSRVMRYIARLHANAASVVWNLCDPRNHSDVVRACSGTLSLAGVEDLTREAEARGLFVQYRPLVRVGPPSGWSVSADSWEGHIAPRSQHAWFASLYAAERPYLRAAQRLGVAQVVVGTELHKLRSSPQWPWFLARVRTVYHGSVVVDQLQSDYLAGSRVSGAAPGMDPYPDLNLPDSATQAQVTAAFASVFAHGHAGVLRATAMEEVGFASVHGAYDAPQRWQAPGPANYVMQKRYFTAACRTIVHYHMAGIWFYEINLGSENPDVRNPFPAFFAQRPGARAIRRCAEQILRN